MRPSEDGKRLNAGDDDDDDDHIPEYLHHSSLWIFGPNNPLRLYVVSLISSPRFANFILMLIFGSALVLAMESPKLDPDSTFKHNLTIVSEHHMSASP